MEWSVCDIRVVSIAMGVEPFERGIKLSSERVKLGKGYWVFVFFFFLLGFIIDLLLLFLLFVQIFFLLSRYVYFFFFIDFSCYLFVWFFVSICKILGEGVKYINFKAKIKIIFVNIYIYIYIFFQSWRGWPPQPLSSSITEYDQSYIYIYISYKGRCLNSTTQK